MVLLSKLSEWCKVCLRKWLAETPNVGGSLSAPSTIEEGAAETVERARQGEQVAIAIICEVRDNAKQGDARAKASFKALQNYIKQNPIGESQVAGETSEVDELASDLGACIGNDESFVGAVVEKAPEVAKRSLKKAIVTLANGPSLLPKDGVNRVRQVGECFKDEEEKQAFIMGAKFCADALGAMKGMSHECQHALMLGYIMGSARLIQAIRLPQVPLSKQSAMVGWELGE